MTLSMTSGAAAIDDVALTERLASLTLKTSTEDLPGPVSEATKGIILDTLACTVAAHGTQVGDALLRWKARQGGTPDATLVVDGTRLPASSIANIHSQLANLLDADETLHNFAHFASTIVMPALAVGEMTGASGSEIIAAVATGFEVAARIGLSIPDYFVSPDGMITRYDGSGFSWAAFGTAAASARLLGLDVSTLRHALGIAYVTTPIHGCLASFVSSMGKAAAPWHKYAMYGTIAEAGVNAALLAREGFRASPSVLDRGSEFWRPFGAHGFDWQFLERDLGDRWFITETSVKPYPFCRYGNSMLDLFGGIVAEQGLTLKEIDSVLVTVVPFDPIRVLVESREPENLLDITFSIPYAMALLGSGVPAGPAWWDEAHLRNPEFAAFARKVNCRIEASWHDMLLDQIESVGRFRRIPTAVRVEARGQVFEASSEFAKGDPLPDRRLDATELADKVRRFAGGTLPPDQVDMMISVVRSLEDLDDITELMALCVRQ